MTPRGIARCAVLLAFLLALGAQSHPPAADDPVPDGPHLPRPASTYRDHTAAGLPIRLDYYIETEVPFLAFRIDAAPTPAMPAPTLDEEGQHLGRLLDRLAAEHSDLPPVMHFATDTFAFVAVLRNRLLAPGANWDTRRGRPHHGELGQSSVPSWPRNWPPRPSSERSSHMVTGLPSTASATSR